MINLSSSIKVFDFFCGCGGTCRGFANAGMDIVFALDNDPIAGKTFKRNFPDVNFFLHDIRSLACEDLLPLIKECEGHPILFSACAPCQPFTKQKTKHRQNDNRVNLLDEFIRFLEYFKVEYLFIENVPGLQKVKSKGGPFGRLIRSLKKMGYNYKYKVVASQSYGVPQIRRRLVLVASRYHEIDIPSETHGPNGEKQYSKVRDWIIDLPPIDAGEIHPLIPNHRAASLSPDNLKRIAALEEGEDRRHWPDNLKLKCHSNGYRGHTDVYGRMKWDKPATGLTTRCISLSNGRFGHPEQDRAISIREAACLQTFPGTLFLKET